MSQCFPSFIRERASCCIQGHADDNLVDDQSKMFPVSKEHRHAHAMLHAHQGWQKILHYGYFVLRSGSL